MEQVTSLLERMDLNASKETGIACNGTSSKKPVDCRGIQILTKLKVLYPAKFGNMIRTQEEMMTQARIWQISLKNISNEIVNKALEKCVDKFKWPPEVAEFKELCMSIQGPTNIPWAEDVLKFEKPKQPQMSNMEVKRLIDGGAEICKKLKKIYPDKSWMTIARVFSDLKKATRPFHLGCSESELINILMKFSQNDMVEALSLGN